MEDDRGGDGADSRGFARFAVSLLPVGFEDEDDGEDEDDRTQSTPSASAGYLCDGWVKRPTPLVPRRDWRDWGHAGQT